MSRASISRAHAHLTFGGIAHCPSQHSSREGQRPTPITFSQRRRPGVSSDYCLRGAGRVVSTRLPNLRNASPPKQIVAVIIFHRDAASRAEQAREVGPSKFGMCPHLSQLGQTSAIVEPKPVDFAPSLAEDGPMLFGHGTPWPNLEQWHRLRQRFARCWLDAGRFTSSPLRCWPNMWRCRPNSMNLPRQSGDPFPETACLNRGHRRLGKRRWHGTIRGSRRSKAKSHGRQ